MSDITALESRLAVLEAENRSLRESRSNPLSIALSIMLSWGGAGGVSAGVVNYQQNDLEAKLTRLEVLRSELTTMQYRLQHVEDNLDELGTFRLKASELTIPVYH